MSARLLPAHRAILQALERHHVQYVLIGGVALQVYGASHITNDVDVSVATDEANVQRLNRVLAEIGARDGMPGAFGTTFQTHYGRFELVRNADAIGDFDGWARRAQREQIDGLSIRVAHPDDVLRSKEAAHRAKDLDVLPTIRAELLRAGRITPAEVRGDVAQSPSGDPPAFLIGVLGDRPAQERARRLWDNGAQRILEHRERWGIEDPDRALGATPRSPAERHDRVVLERALDRSRDFIARSVEPRGSDRAR